MEDFFKIVLVVAIVAFVIVIIKPLYTLIFFKGTTSKKEKNKKSAYVPQKYILPEIQKLNYEYDYPEIEYKISAVHFQKRFQYDNYTNDKAKKALIDSIRANPQKANDVINKFVNANIKYQIYLSSCNNVIKNYCKSFGWEYCSDPIPSSLFEKRKDWKKATKIVSYYKDTIIKDAPKFYCYIPYSYTSPAGRVALSDTMYFSFETFKQCYNDVIACIQSRENSHTQNNKKSESYNPYRPKYEEPSYRQDSFRDNKAENKTPNGNDFNNLKTQRDAAMAQNYENSREILELKKKISMLELENKTIKEQYYENNINKPNIKDNNEQVSHGKKSFNDEFSDIELKGTRVNTSPNPIIKPFDENNPLQKRKEEKVNIKTLTEGKYNPKFIKCILPESATATSAIVKIQITQQQIDLEPTEYSVYAVSQQGELCSNVVNIKTNQEKEIIESTLRIQAEPNSTLRLILAYSNSVDEILMETKLYNKARFKPLI